MMLSNILCSMLMILSIVSCGHNSSKQVRIGNVTDPYFYAYLELLPIDSITPIIFTQDIDIKHKDSKEIVAYCSRYSDGYKEIVVERKYWDKIGEESRLNILAHEIGHCDYDFKHRNKKFPNGCPVSIMHESVFGGKCFNDNFEYYMKEFH